jgi:hypothetical protein
MGFAIGSPVGARHGIHIRMISEDFLKNLSGTRKILAPWLDSGKNIPQSHIVGRKNIPWIQYKSTLQHGWILIPLAADAWLHFQIELLLAMHDRHCTINDSISLGANATHFKSCPATATADFIYPNLQRGFCKYDSRSPTHNKCTTKILYISYDALVHIMNKKDSNFFLQRFFVSPSMTAKFTMSVFAQTWCVYTTSDKSAIFNLQRSLFLLNYRDICEYPTVWLWL